MFPRELRNDLRNQRFEARAPSILLRINGAVARHHPPHLARSRRPQQIAGIARLARADRRLYRVHGCDQASLGSKRDPLQQPRNVRSRALVEPGKLLLSLAGQRQERLTAIMSGADAVDEVILLEPAENATEITVIEGQVAGELRGSAVGPMRELIKHARRGQGEGSV